MGEQGYRRVFALSGLVLGLILMWSLGFGGMIPGAIFGAAGSVAGGILGERLAARRTR